MRALWAVPVVTFVMTLTAACGHTAEEQTGILVTTNNFYCHMNVMCPPTRRPGVHVELRTGSTYRLIGTFKSGDGGRVLIRVGPGRYWLAPVRGIGERQFERTAVTVRPKHLTRVGVYASGPV